MELTNHQNTIWAKMDKIFFGTPFKIIYLIYGFFAYFNVTFGTGWMKVPVWGSVALGVILIIYRLIRIPNYIKTKRIWLLIAFLISYVISIAVNLDYGYAEAVKALVWMGFHYFLLYACDVTQEPDAYKKEFYIMANIYLFILFAAAVVSFVFLCMNYSYILVHSGSQVIGGFTWGRLWGIFTDPNYGSVFCSAGIILSIYFFNIWKNVFLRICYCINILMLSIYLIFSDSRTGLVSVILALGFYVYALLIRWDKLKLKMVWKQVCCILIAIVVMVGVFFLPKGVTKAYNAIILHIAASQQIPDENNQTIIDDTVKEKKFGREQDIEDDFTNQRFDLWMSGIEIFSTRPILGVSFFNLIPYATANLPDTFMINNDFGEHGNLHNAYLNILAGQGIVGFTISVLFSAAVIIYVFRRFLRVDQKDYHYIITLMGAVLACGVSAMFVSDIFYIHSPNSYIFWSFLGYLMHYFRNNIPLPFKGFNKKQEKELCQKSV